MGLGSFARLCRTAKLGINYHGGAKCLVLPGSSQRTSVNQLQIETSLSYNLPHDWYLLTAPTFSADWTQSRGDRWLIPLGGGVGRTVEIAKNAVDWNIALYSNAIRPFGRDSPKWQMSLQCTLLHPRGR